ncbi:unnamed protein product [Peniophora sp. CBMAI 1063]|nr:unnamed protein product [Peniophora sp. CBMAI 1063]
MSRSPRKTDDYPPHEIPMRSFSNRLLTRPGYEATSPSVSTTSTSYTSSVWISPGRSLEPEIRSDATPSTVSPGNLTAHFPSSSLGSENDDNKDDTSTRHGSYTKLSQFVPMTPTPATSITSNPNIRTPAAHDSDSLTRMEHDLDTAQSDAESLRADMRLLEKELSNRQSRLEEANKTTESANDAIRTARSEQQRLADRVRELSEQLDIERRNNKSRTDTIDELRQQVTIKENELRLAVSERDTLRTSRVALQAAVDELQPVQTEVATLRDELERTRADLETAHTDAAEALQRVQDLEAELDARVSHEDEVHQSIAAEVGDSSESVFAGVRVGLWDPDEFEAVQDNGQSGGSVLLTLQAQLT